MEGTGQARQVGHTPQAVIGYYPFSHGALDLSYHLFLLLSVRNHEREGHLVLAESHTYRVRVAHGLCCFSLLFWLEYPFSPRRG